jgi:hypothetical protein
MTAKSIVVAMNRYVMVWVEVEVDTSRGVPASLPDSLVWLKVPALRTL